MTAAGPSAAEVAPGEELIPGYRAVARLAHGGRVDTWDALDEDRGTRCVVKILRPDRVDEPDIVAAVVREGEVLTRLQHPHLVRCFHTVGPPRPAVVLETLRGATVGAVLDDGPIPVPDVAMLGTQVASALHYLHRHGWLHLDVKPDNVVAEHGKAVLIDLSLAGRIGEDGRPGAGTPGYLAPEQATGLGLGPHTDVYGLGITLWEALSGDLARGEDPWDRPEGRRALAHRPIRRPRGAARQAGRRDPLARARAQARRIAAHPTLPNDTPADLAALLSAAIDPDPAARPTLPELTAGLAPHTDQSG